MTGYSLARRSLLLEGAENVRLAPGGLRDVPGTEEPSQGTDSQGAGSSQGTIDDDGSGGESDHMSGDEEEIEHVWQCVSCPLCNTHVERAVHVAGRA